jgi:type I restriction enzyme S subunit
MKQGKMSRSRLSGLKDEQDLGTQKIRKSLNQANPDADNKQDWEIEEFEKCLEKVTYTNKIQRKDFKEEGVYPIISQERDFINGYWDNEEDLFRVDKPVVIFGDHTQVIKFIDFDFVLGADGVKILKPKDKIDSKYFYYFLQNIDLGSLGYARHYRILKEINVSYPKSLSEQQRIVSILDECFAAIAKAKANAEQNLKNAKELFESYLQGVFEKKGEGWEIKTLGEVSKINYGYTEKASFEKVGPKFLRITDIQENGVDWDTVPYCMCSDKDFTKYKLETGDIVFARTGATTGKSYLIYNPPNSVFASYLIRLRMNSINEFIPEFIAYFFQTKTYWDKINAGISGSAQGGFNATKLGELEFHFPKSKEAQQTIVRQLDALRAETQKLEAVYQKKIADLEELKKSILQKAFAGELKTEKVVTV